MIFVLQQFTVISHHTMMKLVIHVHCRNVCWHSQN